jgi:hypothetical protein
MLAPFPKPRTRGETGGDSNSMTLHSQANEVNLGTVMVLPIVAMQAAAATIRPIR